MAETSAPAAASSAAPTPAQSSDPVKNATNEVLKGLPQDQKNKNAQPVEATGEIEDTGEDLPKEVAKKNFKLKVDGRDVEVDEGELVKRAQMGYSADKKWQEAAEMKKQLQDFIGFLQKDPASALEQMGFNVDELAEQRIQQRIEEMKKSPEQLEREKMQKELEQMKAEREKEKESARNQEMQRLQDHFAVEIENDISGALDDNSYGFPKTPYVVKRIADTMILAMEEGRKTNNQALMNIKAKDVLGLVQEEIRRELHDMYALSPDEVFEQLIGKDRLNKYRRGKIKRPKADQVPGSTQNIKSTGTREMKEARDKDQDQSKVKMKDFFKKLGSR